MDDMRTNRDTSQPTRDKRIFVVESDEVIRSALQFILEDGNETHGLASLEKAYARGDTWKPDLVLLGVSIVRSQGVRVLDDIGVRLPGAKILLVVDSRNDPLAQLCLAAGADDVLGKPIATDPVCDKVDLLLGRRKRSKASLEIRGVM
jgi:DNA-binding response OmpR family regulator